MRIGVERGLVLSLGTAATLLALTALPAFLRTTDSAAPIGPLLLVLLTVMVVAIPPALLTSKPPSRVWLQIPPVSYVLLVIVGRMFPSDVVFAASNSWPLSLACVAFGCVAVSTFQPVRALVGCVAVVCGPALIYRDLFSRNFIAVSVLGVMALSAVLIVAITVLRVRADQADHAERRARDLFQVSRQRAALEAERIRTDALLHDSVLASLLAAGNDRQTDGQSVLLAAQALDVVQHIQPHVQMDAAPVPFESRIDHALSRWPVAQPVTPAAFQPIADVVLPPSTADALIDAAIQATTNSARHAGATATCSVTARKLCGGGIRIVVADDGVGFDPARIPAGRLGVRGSIVDRVQDAGGTADVRSRIGAGTTVTLEWHPPVDDTQPADPPQTPVSMVSRSLLRRILVVFVALSILVASLQAVLVYRAPGPFLAVITGLVLLPILIHGARSGRMPTRTAWGVVAVGYGLIFCATWGVVPEQANSVSIAWYTCGILGGAGMLRMTGHRLAPLTAVIALVIHVTMWAGPDGVLRLGLAGELVLWSAALVLNHAIARVNRKATAATTQHRLLTAHHAAVDAHNSERCARLARADREAAPMLRRIVQQHGDLTPTDRAECRMLEQLLRDEIRGRALLNDAVRTAVRTLRQRGAFVQLLDDGGLDGIAAADLAPLLDRVASEIAPLHARRIIVRTAQPDTDAAITIVASTPDETAAALGLDTDDHIDLWTVIPRPVRPASQRPLTPATAPALLYETTK